MLEDRNFIELALQPRIEPGASLNISKVQVSPLHSVNIAEAASDGSAVNAPPAVKNCSDWK